MSDETEVTQESALAPPVVTADPRFTEGEVLGACAEPLQEDMVYELVYSAGKFVVKCGAGVMMEFAK